MLDNNDYPITRVLISVSDKIDIVEFAKQLAHYGVEILSTGGTAKLLVENAIHVTEVSEHTGFPEIMNGRVKTLHPKIHGGILGRRDRDQQIMHEHGIKVIDMVVVNLYPFESTVAAPDCSPDKAVEYIDIGGPAMVRAAAKNHAHVSVVVDPRDYHEVLKLLEDHDGAIPAADRLRLAVKAFAHTARYDAAIANYLGGCSASIEQGHFPGTYTGQWVKVQELRYGENPHQHAAFYRDLALEAPCIASARQLQGKELSYNNIADSDAALECVKQFDAPACVIVKHANPCGVAAAASLLEAYQKAYQTDPTSAFGGIIAVNRELDAEFAQAITEQQFVEVIVAPSVTQAASQVLLEKPNLRVMECGFWQSIDESLDFKRVVGGMLLQQRDTGMLQASQLEVVTQTAPSAEQLDDLLFAWRVVKFVKSNAIVYARDQRTIGIGAGQMSRVYSAKIAAIKAHDEDLEVRGAVMASDAFFPFRDAIDAAHQAGISAVIQPGGSMRDEEVIAAADEHGMAMVLTHMRHFRH